MNEKTDILTACCAMIDADALPAAAAMLARDYPFTPIIKNGRQYTAAQCMQVFARDGFIDRYSGQRLVCPGTLRLLSRLMPAAFPFQSNWKSDSCHFAYYELFPTIDHRTPVARGGLDQMDNWISTSMLRNAAKANFTVEELEWTLHPCGDISAWDGLTGWFMQQARIRPDISSDPYLSRWLRAARNQFGDAHPEALP